MDVVQVSIFLENKPGHLQNALQVLADRNINIRTLTIAEMSDFGIVRMIVNQPDAAIQTLKANGFTCSSTEVLALELEDVPGALSQTLDTLRQHALNIEYMYAFTQKRGDRAVMIFKFNDMASARRVLVEEGYKIVKGADIAGTS